MSSKTTNRPRSTQASNTSSTSTGNINTKGEKAAAPSAWSNPAPNAWSRPLKTRPPPGLPQATGTALPTSQNGATAPNPILRERFLHLTLSLVGQRVSLTLTDGTVLEGIFHTITPFSDLPAEKKNRVVVKAVRLIKGDREKIAHGSTVVITADKVISIHCKSLRLGTANGKGDTFRTDSEISSTQSDKGRDLVAAGSAWTTAGTPAKGSRADALLADSPRKAAAGLRGNIGEWDQFRANEELFNVQAKFDENIYTTELDKSTIDSARIKEAERLAREIESTTSSNIHIADERNQTVLGHYDEEDRYSGVLTEQFQTRNKDPAPPKKAMNYAAAAAKADAGKTGPPGFAAAKKDELKVKATAPPPEEVKEENIEDSKLEPVLEKEIVEDAPRQEEIKVETEQTTPPLAEEKESETSISENKTVEVEVAAEEHMPEEKNTAESENTDTSETKNSTKLNANAKSFTFNPAAKTFTPSFVVPAPVVLAPTHIPQQMIDPSTGAPLHPHIPGQQHFMHTMGHPAMMHMMNPQFAHMRYPGGYPGMEQLLPPGLMHSSHPQHMQQQPQPQQEGQQQAPPGGDEHQQSGETVKIPSQQQPLDPQGQPGQHSSHPGVPVPYPPNASPYLYGGGMPMQRGPGGQMGGYHPHMGGGPQQIPVVQANSFRHLYGMHGMPQPPPQMRGPNGAPYYPAAPPHYAHYMGGDVDDYRGGRGGRGAGRGRRGGRKGGRVGPGRGYQSWNATMQNGGRYTPQNTPSEDPTPAEQRAASSTDETPPAE